MVDILAHPKEEPTKTLEYDAEFYYYLGSTELILKMYTLSDLHSNTTSAKCKFLGKSLHFLLF